MRISDLKVTVGVLEKAAEPLLAITKVVDTVKSLIAREQEAEDTLRNIERLKASAQQRRVELTEVETSITAAHANLQKLSEEHAVRIGALDNEIAYKRADMLNTLSSEKETLESEVKKLRDGLPILTSEFQTKERGLSLRLAQLQGEVDEEEAHLAETKMQLAKIKNAL